MNMNMCASIASILAKKEQEGARDVCKSLTCCHPVLGKNLKVIIALLFIWNK
jgi:hypothetical protein